MPRILLKIDTRNRIKACAYKQPDLPSERLWLSVAGLAPYPCSVTAALSRSVNPPAIIALPALATLASSLSGRPTFVEVKPQPSKRRKRVRTPYPPGSPATTTSSRDVDDASSKSSDFEDMAASVRQVLVDPPLLEVEITPVRKQAREILTPPSSSFKRHRVSLILTPSSLLLSPAADRPSDAKFSPGQVLWASSMLSAIMDGRVLAGDEYESVDCSFLVKAVIDGAFELEKDFVVELGMDGQARNEKIVELDRMLEVCLKKREVVEEEMIEEEESEEEMSDAEEEVEDIVGHGGEEEEAAIGAAERSPSSDDEDFSEDEEDD